MNFRVSKSTIIKTIVVNLVLLPNLFLVQQSSAIDFGFESKSDFVSTFSQNDILFWDPEACANNGNLQSSSHYTGGIAEISGTTAMEKIWSGLKSVGLSDEVAAGTLGNMMHEGGLSPARYEDQWRDVWESGFDWETNPTSGYGVGLIQWSGGRRINFFKWMREQNNELVEKYIKKPGEYGALSGDSFIQKVNNLNEINTLYSLEITFLMNEIQTNPVYGGVLKETTVDGAAGYFSIYIEGCTKCTNPNSGTYKERVASAQEVYAKFSGRSKFDNGGQDGKYSDIDPDCDCNDNGNIGANAYAGAKYSFTDEELKRLWWAASTEQGTETGRKNELSIFANVYEKEGGEPGNNQGLIDKVTERYRNGNKSGWFDQNAGKAYETGCSDWECYPEPSSDIVAAAKDILNNGNRTIPIEIDEHVSLGAVTSATNNGSNIDTKNRSQYQSGVTIIHTRMGGTYTFFQWANGNKECPDNSESCGDPFGYTGDAPSASNSTVNSNITWTSDGWIQGGIEGYVKEPAEGALPGLDPAAGKEFATDAINGSGKGPNKILLHSTEGPNGSGTSGLEFYSGNPYPPHFTIDVKERHLFQHFPLYKTSAAIKSHDDIAGIQIEIIGYSDAALAKRNGREQWILANFSDDEVSYLANLLIGISNATGIPLTSSVEWTSDTDPPRLSLEEFRNYKGILGHRHATDNDHWDPVGIWEKLEKALADYSPNECPDNLTTTGDVKALQETVLKFAWPDYRQDDTTKKPEYQEALNQGGYAGGCDGVDCGAFVYQTITKSGWDPDFPSGPTSNMQNELQNSSKWTDVTSSIQSNNDAKPGDVILVNNDHHHHVLLFVGDIPGFNSKMASASLCDRAPMADSAGDISHYIQSGFHIYRRN